MSTLDKIRKMILDSERAKKILGDSKLTVVSDNTQVSVKLPVKDKKEQVKRAKEITKRQSNIKSESPHSRHIKSLAAVPVVATVGPQTVLGALGATGLLAGSYALHDNISKLLPPSFIKDASTVLNGLKFGTFGLLSNIKERARKITSESDAELEEDELLLVYDDAPSTSSSPEPDDEDEVELLKKQLKEEQKKRLDLESRNFIQRLLNKKTSKKKPDTSTPDINSKSSGNFMKKHPILTGIGVTELGIIPVLNELYNLDYENKYPGGEGVTWSINFPKQAVNIWNSSLESLARAQGILDKQKQSSVQNLNNSNSSINIDSTNTRRNSNNTRNLVISLDNLTDSLSREIYGKGNN